MATRDKSIERPRILTGWKDIARHLGMGVRTVQRYERILGLPVRRPAGRPRGAVVATISELDAWVSASPIREAFQLTKATPELANFGINQTKRRLDEMRALRDQMQALRKELRESLQTLRENIGAFRDELTPGHWDPPALSTLEHNPQTRNLMKWLSEGPKRKTN